MKTLKIVLEGEAPVKKNQRKEAWTKKDKKTGVIKALKFKASWYTPIWNDYAALAIQRLYKWKQIVLKQTGVIRFPLRGEFVVSMVFFRRKTLETKLDLDNLEGGILDILAGNSGVKLDAAKWKIDHEDYKILHDDSIEFVRSHGASTCFYAPTNPHTEVFISDFTLEKYSEVFKIWHPQAELGWMPTNTPSLFEGDKITNPLDDL